MNKSEGIQSIEGLKSFNQHNSNDISFDLYKNFMDSEEEFKKYGNAFSDFYYISCTPFEKDLNKRKHIPEIYDILKRCVHMANGHPLEILIGKYSEESMERARKITEEKRKEFEGSGLIIGAPKSYMYLVGFFGGTSGRNNQFIINQIKETFPDKIRTIKAD